MDIHNELDPEHGHHAMDVPDPGTELARHLADIANVMLAPGGATTAAERILALAIATMDTCDDAALCGNVSNGRPPAGSWVMVELDALQTCVGEGPCLDAQHGIGTFYVHDLLDDQSWPAFSPEAVRYGFRSTLAYSLSFQGQILGALQLYAHLPGAFNATERAQGLIFASYAGLAMAQANANADAQAEAQAVEDARAEHFQTALSSREVIGQAQGILMERERITADQAFQLLRRSSQHLNRKLRAVAQDIVDFGATPAQSTHPNG